MGKAVGTRPAPAAKRAASSLPRIRAAKAIQGGKLPAATTPAAGMQLHTADGARKYLTASEREGFLREAERGDRQVRTLCMTLAYAGCRLSEALVF